MLNIFLDTETCGLHGMAVLLQYAEDDGPVTLHEIFREPVGDTLKIIEHLVANNVIAFNLVFDWFHLCKIYTIFSLLAEKYGEEVIPVDYIDEIVDLEEPAQDGPCLKPAGAFDLMLHARKGPYQSTMDRGDIRIRRVPTKIAWMLAEELGERIPLKDVYFARKKNKKERWKVYDIKDDFDEVVPDFKDIVLKFAPSSALKALAGDALGIEDVVKFDDVELDKSLRPFEVGWAPTAKGAAKAAKWARNKKSPHKKFPDVEESAPVEAQADRKYNTWPLVIKHHINHWAFNKKARKYATKDVEYLQRLYEEFGKPPVNDNDSILAAQVAAARWRGYTINIDAVKKLRSKLAAELRSCPFNFQSSAVCRKYIEQVLSPIEAAVLRDGKGNISTKGIILEEIAKWKVAEVCDDCYGEGCDQCDDGMLPSDELHPAAIRAKNLQGLRQNKKRLELLDKLIIAGKFHASLKIIGTLSSRMSGADGMNPQGIPHEKEFRQLFTLAHQNEILTGGDFSGFEICLMDAAYNDPVLRSKLQEKRDCFACDATGKVIADEKAVGKGYAEFVGQGLECPECKGETVTNTKIHGLFGTYLFPGMTYDDVLATKKMKGAEGKYDRAKAGVYAVAYGGEAYTLQTRVGIDPEAAEEAFRMWCEDHKVWGEERRRIFDMFCSMRQPNGPGSKVYWNEPSDYVESMFGFRRYFTLENMITKTLFEMAEDPPKRFKELTFKVTRRDREQTAVGATRSALFGAAFQIQASNMRAAGNHVIQSSGATTCKALQCDIWDYQPIGIHKWKVQPLNIHDEIMCSTVPELIDHIDETVKVFIKQLKETVPLAEIEWDKRLETWGS